MADRPIPSLNALRSFDATARHLSQTRAAEELCVTPSAVSKQIALLEDYFGFELFEREQRGIRLTPRGAKCARATAAAFKQLSRELQQVMQPRAEPLRLIGDADFMQLWMVPKMPAFRAAHPELTVELQAEIDGANAESRHDCALSWGQRVWDRSTTIEPIFLNSNFVVGAPGSVASERIRNTPEMLVDEDLINDRKPGWWERFSTELGLDHLNPHVSPTYPTTAMCMDAAAMGQGLAIADEVTSRSYLADGRLEIVVPLKIQTADAYYATWRDDPGKDPRLERFRGWILSEAEEHRQWFDTFWSAQAFQPAPTDFPKS